MELVLGLIGIVSGVAIPVYLHFKSHPKREIRYAVAPSAPGVTPGVYEWRVALWSSGRAEIPTALFDSNRAIVLRFSEPITFLSTTATGGVIEPLRSTTSTALALPAQLLRQEFRAEAQIAITGPFSVTVENPLIGVDAVRDAKAEAPAPAQQEQAVQRSKKRSRITFLRIATWLTIASFACFVLGISLALGGLDAGAGFGIPGMILTPIGLVLLAIAGIRNLVLRTRRRSQA